MVVIYTQDNTFIKKDADEAREDLLTLYGPKLGAEAYKAVKDAPVGTSYRMHGGPLVRVVDESMGAFIHEKEAKIGMM